ncbi:MAG: hypothetical protein NC319_01870 [Butyricicoccus sp.]|nr:hypothetical protein [Butyricicoccus sp.]
MMKKINTHGIISLEPLDGSPEWYWGSDYTHGDLYEAEELYRDHHPVNCNRLVFVQYPDGRVVEPIEGKAGQYFGRPISYNGKIQILLADFPKAQLSIVQYDDAANQVATVASLPLTEVKDCYNLLLRQSPLMLTQQRNDGRFQIIWPEKIEFSIEETEHFFDRKGDKFYFCRWHDEPDYWEEIVIRQYPTGEILEVIPGAWMSMPDGQVWVLQ